LNEADLGLVYESSDSSDQQHHLRQHSAMQSPEITSFEALLHSQAHSHSGHIKCYLTYLLKLKLSTVHVYTRV